MKIAIASNNPGKILEIQSVLSHLNLISQSELGISDIEETGLTFVENALIKARHVCRETGLSAIADDSGLSVAALNGAPGIYSARYAGNNAHSKENIEKLLKELKNVPEGKRQASFHCVLVYMAHANDPIPIICHGIWQGSILTEPRGDLGFGYDPIFYVSSERKSAAELPLAIKNQLSHRGIALRLLHRFLTS